MRDIDVILFVSCSGTLIYIINFQSQPNLKSFLRKQLEKWNSSISVLSFCDKFLSKIKVQLLVRKLSRSSHLMPSFFKRFSGQNGEVLAHFPDEMMVTPFRTRSRRSGDLFQQTFRTKWRAALCTQFFGNMASTLNKISR